jgi:phenylpropionate dioxygenase-like ring-hydroxylating dioxygenase large terminal subunit
MWPLELSVPNLQHQPMTTPHDTHEQATTQGVMLRDAWYYAAPSTAVARSKTIHRTMLSEPILIGRDESGKVFALRDTCPHRGTLLSRGAFDGQEIECPYHGWRFAVDGRCTAIPSQTANQKPQPSDIRAHSYSVAELHGNIWVYIGKATTPLPPVPEVPAIGHRFGLHISTTFECNIDLAVAGLMDPAHGAFVHRSALWRTKKSIHEKTKSFSPLQQNGQIGWRMDRHRASSNSRAYRLFLGGAPETEITYMMPSVRVEHASTGRYDYAGLTACTPITATRTEVHHVMYWNVPGGNLLRPLVRAFAWRFLDQDRRAVMDMVAGQAFDPPTMLIKDADQQTRWYFTLKREWLAAAAENRPMRNPIGATRLSWRS